MKTTRFLGTAAALAMGLTWGCGGDGVTGPTPPPRPIPNVAGTYTNWEMWRVQFVRPHDGYAGSWTCPGTLTLTQVSGSGILGGFAVVQAPCVATSFEVTGLVKAGGALALDMSGPTPGAGTCPPLPGDTTFSGTVSGSTLSVRGTAAVSCPGAGEGEYRFDEIVTGYKYD